eukprot:594705-Rhodomonas_salina.1
MHCFSTRHLCLANIRHNCELNGATRVQIGRLGRRDGCALLDFGGQLTRLRGCVGPCVSTNSFSASRYHVWPAVAQTRQ